MDGTDTKPAETKVRRGVLSLPVGQFHFWGAWFRKRMAEAIKPHTHGGGVIGEDGFLARFVHDQLVTLDVQGSIELTLSDFQTIRDFTYIAHSDARLREEGKVDEADELLRQRDRFCGWLDAGWKETVEGQQESTRPKYEYTGDRDDAAEAWAEAKKRNELAAVDVIRRRQLAKECEEVGKSQAIPDPGKRPREPPAAGAAASPQTATQTNLF